MSSAGPAELSADVVIERIEAGQFPPAVVENIARGFLPLAQEELIPILAYLARSPEGEIAAAARASLGDIPSRSVHAFASNEAARPQHLALLLGATGEPFILEALIRNRGVSDALVAELAASTADAAVQDVIVTNQARIIRAPEILDALLGNPHLGGDVRRRALEVREEFFDKKARAAAAAAEAAEADEDEAMMSLSLEPVADLLEQAAAEGETAAAPPPQLTPAEESDEKKQSIFSKILTMNVSQKVQLAFRGGKTERMILVRDHNKLVCSAVMRNPRMTDLEVESIAGMRNVEEEVLRLIAQKREWMSKYTILISLARNPKCPVGVVLPLINRLTLRDLKGLKDDKGVSETVRTMARKLFLQRNSKS